MFQFSTRTLFVIMSASAGLAWVFFAPPQWVGFIALYCVYLMLPATTLAGIIYHRDAWRAFFIGCAPFVATITVFFWLMIMGEFPRFTRGDWLEMPNGDAADLVLFKLFIAIPLVVTVFSGVTAVLVRAWAVRLQRRECVAEHPPS